MRLFYFFFGLILLTTSSLQAAVAVPPPVKSATITPADLSREAVEAQLGRKLKFTERIALSVVRGKAKRQARKQARRGPDGTVVDGLAVTSMILGLVGFLGTTVTIFAGVFAIGALVLGIVSLGLINRDAGYRTGKGFAIAGIALGGTWLFLFLLAIALLLLIFR